MEPQVKGQLNPDWVEMLMGLPAGWSKLDGLRDSEGDRTTMNHQE
jgi:hypothetical protein